MGINQAEAAIKCSLRSTFSLPFDFVELLDTFFKTSASPQGPLGFAACQSKSFGWF